MEATEGAINRGQWKPGINATLRPRPELPSLGAGLPRPLPQQPVRLSPHQLSFRQSQCLVSNRKKSTVTPKTLVITPPVATRTTRPKTSAKRKSNTVNRLERRRPRCHPHAKNMTRTWMALTVTQNGQMKAWRRRSSVGLEQQTMTAIIVIRMTILTMTMILTITTIATTGTLMMTPSIKYM